VGQIQISAAGDRPRGQSFVLECGCGRPVALDQEACECGRSSGAVRDGFVITGGTPYWGELPPVAMRALIDGAAIEGWQAAMRRHVPAALHAYIAGSERADFKDVLGLSPGSAILDVGAGLGAICTQLALQHRVVALESVRERCEFIAARRREDCLDNLSIVNGTLDSTPFCPAQFDAIVVNGVLEWAALFDLSGSPGDAQVRFLQQLRRLLRPGGIIYIGIENRFGWWQIRGATDHSGMPYTGLLPRWIADRVCRWKSRRYRSPQNEGGYRTYTYSYSGFQKLFRRAGLRQRAAMIHRHGYNRPDEIVPLLPEAIRFYRRAQRLAVRPRSLGRQLAARLHCTYWFWRRFGPEFGFIVQSAAEPLPQRNEWIARLPLPRGVTALVSFVPGQAHPSHITKIAGTSRAVTQLRQELEMWRAEGSRTASRAQIVHWTEGVEHASLTLRCTRGRAEELLFPNPETDPRSRAARATPAA
jgi:SAM-dependent methyltransferase